jgi:predicted nucleic acid-binding Zn ribbon protein
MKPLRVQASLAHVLRRIDPDDRMRAYRLWHFWNEEVGETIARHAQPVGLRAGVLSIAVDAPTWLQELQFLEDTLRERLNHRLGQKLIDDIYIVSGAVGTPKPRATAPAMPTIGPVPDPLPPIRNPELAAAFARILDARARRAERES